MNPHQILIVIAIICELAAIGPWIPANLNMMALGFVFFFISLLVG